MNTAAALAALGISYRGGPHLDDLTEAEYRAERADCWPDPDAAYKAAIEDDIDDMGASE